MKCYCISGLGADKRVFQNLDIGFDLIHIEWLKPKKNESLSNYSVRLSEQIDISEPFILLGLSFGGIIACKISEKLNPKSTILISSISSKDNLPQLFKFFGRIKLYKLIPLFLMNSFNPIICWLFGVYNKKEKKLLKTIIVESDANLGKWSIEKILNHEKVVAPKKFIHIHGTKDRLLPCINHTNVFLINEGGHFMIYQNSDLINDIIKNELWNNNHLKI